MTLSQRHDARFYSFNNDYTFMGVCANFVHVQYKKYKDIKNTDFLILMCRDQLVCHRATLLYRYESLAKFSFNGKRQQVRQFIKMKYRLSKSRPPPLNRNERG